MFTEIQVFNDTAKVTGAAFKKPILDRLPQIILDQMHTTDLYGKTDEKLMDVITTAGRTAERLEDTRRNLALRSYRKEDKSFRSLKKETRFEHGNKKNRKP